MAKTLIYDIEITGILGWTYSMYDARVHKVEQQPTMLSFSYKWYGEKRIHHENLSNQTEEQLTIKLRDLFDEADILIAHNANRFDNKVATGKFLQFNLDPPAPYKTIDTLTTIRSIAKLPSNSLNSLGDLFELGQKSTITHADLWYKCLQNDRSAWRLMKAYNNQDVNLLEQLYVKLRPWMKNHPNMGDITQMDGICPKCASPNVVPYGSAPRRNGRVKSYRCEDCGGRCNENTIKRSGRLVNA